MRAMILAAGLGERLRPLTALRPKPALPVRGVPVIAYNLALLARHGFEEVVINVHHLAPALMAAAERYKPAGLRLRFSGETRLLGTGGGIRRVADFLRESDPSLVLAGDMLLDFDLTALIARHRSRGDAVTLLLRDDPREKSFGTIGVDGEARVRRIAGRFDLGGEVRRGVFLSARVFAARAFDSLPDLEAFEDLEAWLIPRLAAGAADLRGEVAGPGDCMWEPVGTPGEYLSVNLYPPRVSYLDADARARAEGTRFCDELVVGAGAVLGEGAELRRAVVWDGEVVPPGFRARDGIFAGGAFHPCPPLRTPG